jgi:hypothetical protein
VSVDEGNGAGVIMVGYYDACKHQPLMPAVNDNVPGLMYSDKAVLAYLNQHVEKVQAHRFVPAAITESVCPHLRNGL